MIKPDGVQRGLVAEVIRRFESKGYRLVGLKILYPTQEQAYLHYEEHKERPFFPKLVEYLSSGPVVAMVWEGKDVVRVGRVMIGATDPTKADPGTVRGDYALDMGRNLIHGSDSAESAEREICLWFRQEELIPYPQEIRHWIYEA